MNKNNNRLLTVADIDDVFGELADDKKRIQYITQHYSKMNLTKAFSIYYNMEVSAELKQNKNINNVIVIEVGGTYTGTVKEFCDNGTIVFSIPGVKEEIVSRDNFNSCREAIENYLLNHDNKLLFEVREKKNNKFIVSVVNAYYNQWQNQINACIKSEDGIYVHIDELVRGGYVCHTKITPLCELTGKEYTSSVFIPGSHIVLNIESDFEKWIGKDVIIVPQKFVEFRKDLATGLIENSLVGSRKRVLQIMGVKNMYQIYNDAMQLKKLAEMSDNVTITEPRFEGTVTGIINSNKKVGVFVELDDKYITGLMPIDASELLNYRPGDSITVKIKEFEIQEGKEPFVINKRKQVVHANVRPVFELA